MSATTIRPPSVVPWLAGTLAALVVWAALYSQLIPFSERAMSLLPVDPASHLGQAIAFFLYDTPKVLLLLALVVFAMGVVRSFFSPERTRALLAGRREGVGNAMAASLGIVTPFCSAPRCRCSSASSPPACRSASPSPS
ncbi:permease [Falsiroseomonas sp. E2-1-a4]|uniref:permease n=1 Tax=Falsiroseomonas sp. E2-1-a4 TaxID=3239299 RepID=UPI003F38430D